MRLENDREAAATHAVILNAIDLTNEALATISRRVASATLVDCYLNALRELHDLLEPKRTRSKIARTHR